MNIHLNFYNEQGLSRRVSGLPLGNITQSEDIGEEGDIDQQVDFEHGDVFDQEEHSAEEDDIFLNEEVDNESIDALEEDPPDDRCACVNVADEDAFLNRKIATTNCPDWNTRIYFQDAYGHIRQLCETDQDGMRWTIAPGHLGIQDAKRGTPLAAISRRNGSEIRIFYVTTRNMLHEWCYVEKRGWFNGSLNESAVPVAPGSQLTAATLGRIVKVYYQATNGGIHECSYEEENQENRWKDKLTPVMALRGSALAAIAYSGEEGMVVRIYYQANDQTVREIVSKGSDSWENGCLLQPTSTDSWKTSMTAKCHTFITAAFFESGYFGSMSKQTTLCFQSPCGNLREIHGEDDEWYDEIEEADDPNLFAEGEEMVLIHQKARFNDVLRGYFIMGDGGIGEISQNTFVGGWSDVKRRPA